VKLFPVPVKGRCGRTSFRRRRAFSYKTTLALTVAVLLLTTAVATWFYARSKAPASSYGFVTDSTLGTPGPWGQLVYTPLEIEPPADYLFSDKWVVRPPRWLFKKKSPEEVLSLFSAAGMPANLLSRLKNARWDKENDECMVWPPDDVIVNMLPDCRAKVYGELDDISENEAQGGPYTFHAGKLDQEIAAFGLSPQTQALLKKMLYRRGDLFLFADIDTLLPKIDQPEEQIKLVKTLTHHSTWLLGLRVTPSSDVDQIVSYWGKGRRRKDLRPLIESLRRFPNGVTIDLSHLLPIFPRSRLYCYPLPNAEGYLPKHDCHWASLNFFNEIPDERFCDPSVTVPTFLKDYVPINGTPEFGDLVLLISEDKVIHSAVYLADGFVFTKNGNFAIQPWMYMRVADMIASYQSSYPPGEALKVVYIRKKTDL